MPTEREEAEDLATRYRQQYGRKDTLPERIAAKAPEPVKQPKQPSVTDLDDEALKRLLDGNAPEPKTATFTERYKCRRLTRDGTFQWFDKDGNPCEMVTSS
jgi:hypothetical protein